MSGPKPPQKDDVIRDADLYLAFRLMKRKEYDGAEHHILEGIKKARREMDETLEGLYNSALGVLYKLKKDFKKAYKYYQQAEKLLPEDNSLKLITTLLLIEEFGQYDTAVRKLDKILEAEKNDPAMVHHARAAKGLAYLKWGKKDKARECLETMLVEDFTKLRSAANLDFKLIEALLKKSLFVEACKAYLDNNASSLFISDF
jgi:tetratricopeptide (TPR) repeat protein